MTQQQNNSLRAGMMFMSMIFFIFGFITTFNITLKDKIQDVFELSSFMAQLVNGVFFVTYFFLSFTCGSIIKKIGYKNGVIAGLLLVAAGSFLFYPAASYESYASFLVAIFVMASGVVFLQTAANPYVAALGSADTSSGRLNLVQALNSIATTIAPWIASVFVFTAAAESMGAKAVQLPFVIIGVIVLLIALGVFFVKLPVIESQEDATRKSVWKYPHVLLGALGIFCYVGAEVGIAAAIIPYLALPETGALSSALAAKYVAIYWGGAMVGRFFGSIMLSKIASSAKNYTYVLYVLIFAFIAGWFVTEYDVQSGFIFLIIGVINFLLMQLGKGKTNLTLAVFALIAAGLVTLSLLWESTWALWAICSIGFFNSVMFPNIFALGVDDLDKSEMSMASGIINTLIVGGAVIPVVMGAMTDSLGIRMSLILPVACYLYIVFYALKGSKIR